MTDLIRPTANIGFDVSDVDGRVNKWGFGYDWLAKAERQEGPSGSDAFTPFWEMTDCEIVPGLDLLGLQGSAPPADMALDDWQLLHGDGFWGLERPDALPNTLWMSYKRSEPDQKGLAVMGSPSWSPRFCVHLLDFVPPPSQTEEVYTAIELRGLSVDVNYRLKLPLHSETEKYPSLQFAEGAISDETEWITRDRLERTDYASSAMDTRILRRTIWFEETDGCILLRFAGIKEPWIFKPKALEIPTPGFVAVEFKGHAAMFNAVQIGYPTTATAQPYLHQPREEVVNTTASYKWSESFYSRGTVAVAEDSQIADGSFETRPVITLTRTEANNRPLVSVVHEVRDATLTDPRSDSKTTQAQATAMAGFGKDPAELQSLTWRRFMRRGWSFTAELRDPHGIWQAHLKPNMQATIGAGWSGVHDAIMVGYIERPKPDKRASREQGITPTYRITGRDFIGARMQSKKFMLWPASPLSDGPNSRVNGRWFLDEWAQWWLTRCGFGKTFTAPSGIEVKQVDQQGAKELAWDFDQRTEVHKGLDAVFAAHDLSPLAVDVNGNLYTETDVPFSAPADFELDEDTATGDDVIKVIESTVEDADFRNFIAGIAKDGSVEVAYDVDSAETPGDTYYIGDQWMEVLGLDDATSPEIQTATRLAQAMRTRTLVKWTRNLKPDLPPLSWVNVNVDIGDVRADTVMQVIEDTGKLQAGNMNAESTFICELQRQAP